MMPAAGAVVLDFSERKRGAAEFANCKLWYPPGTDDFPHRDAGKFVDIFSKRWPADERSPRGLQPAGELELSDQGAAASGSGGQFSIRRFTTDALPESRRLSIWREEFGRSLVHVDIEPVSGEVVHAEATIRALPGLRTLSFHGSATCMTRTRAMTAASDGSIGLIINRDADALLSQRDCVLSLRNGDACSILTDEPSKVIGRGHLGLLFPRVPLIERVKNLADAAVTRIPQESESLRLLVSYLSVLLGKLTLGSPKLQRSAVEHIYDLVTLAICPDRPADEKCLSATAAARLELARSYISKHFDRPGLTIAAVARNQNISPRYLQRLFETTGSTFSERINELRLQLAYALLTSASSEAGADRRHRATRRLFRYSALQPVIPPAFRRHAREHPGRRNDT